MKLKNKLLTYLFAGAVIAGGIVGCELIEAGAGKGMEAVETSADAVLDRPVIVLDAGHGGADGGCVSVNGIPEKNINLSIMLTARDMLDLLGYDVRCTRETDVSIHDKGIEGLAKQKKSDMDNRLAVINESGAVLAVSIHQNQFTDPKYSGAQMFYSATNKRSEALARSLQDSFRELLQPDNSREIKLCGKELFLCYYSDNPTVMAECGFLSNPEEAALLNTEEYQEKVALTLFSGLTSYIDSLT